MKKVLTLFLTLLLVFILTGLLPVHALEEVVAGVPVDIEAESLSYDREADTYHAKGQVVVTFKGGVLKADTVVLAKGANKASASGQVTVRTGSDVLTGERVEFDLLTNRGVIYAGKMFIAKNHFYISSGKIEKLGEDHYRMEDICLTACDGDKPDWQIMAKELSVTVDGYGTLKGAKFLAADVPVLYIPYLPFPAKTTRQTGLLFPHLGYSRDKLGYDVEIPFFLALSQSADATFYQRYMEKRGFKEGMEFRYFLNKDSYGTIYGDYLRDGAQITENIGALSRDWQSPHNRWSLYVQNHTSFKPDLYMRADITRVSDNWYFKDFSSHNYYLDHYSTTGDERFKKVPFVADESLGALNSTVRVVKDWPLYNLTALVKHTDDLTALSNDATAQKYPEFTLAGARQSFFGTRLNVDMRAALSRNDRAAGQRGSLFDVQPLFSLPLDLGGNFQLTPLAEARGTFWERNDDPAPEKRGERTTYRLGANLLTSLSRDYTVASGGMEKIRHEIRPELVYNYVPLVDQADLPDFAEKVIADNSLAAALTNTLTAKVKGKDGKTRYLELLRFKLIETYDIREARREDVPPGAPRRPLGNLDMELDVKPLQYFAFSLRNRFNVDSGIWEKANYDLYLYDGRGDAVSLGYRYTRDLLEEINLSLKAALTKSLDLAYVFRRNEFDDHNIRNSLGFNYKQQCWSVGLTYADDVNDRSFMLSFSLTGLGSAGGK